MTSGLCHHCGLPVGALGREWEGKWFCCWGCHLAWRIIGEQEPASGRLAAIVVRLGIAGVLAMNVMMISLLLYSDALAEIGQQAALVFRWALLGLSTPVLAILGLPLLGQAVRDARRARASVDSLIAIGSLTGYGVSAVHVIQNQGQVYFDTATMLLVLMTVGRLLEASARTQASRALQELAKLEPSTARVLLESEERTVPTTEVRVGDRVRVTPGERIPVDGVIAAGFSSVHEALLTGEYEPQPRRPGDPVFGGSVNGEGEIVIEATATGERTLVSQMVRLVETARARLAPTERLADRTATFFVPVVVAAAVGAAGFWLYRGEGVKAGMSALAVLVVACPCALGLATPLAVSVAISRAARAGILVRSGEALENLSRVRTLIFDKTGTLTEGRPVVQEVACCPGAGCNEEEALLWLASLESASEHAVGKSIVSAAQKRQLAIGRAMEFRAVPGQGGRAQVEVNGRTREVLAGTAAFLSSSGVDLSCLDVMPAAGPGETLVLVAWEGRARARVRLTDAARPEAAGLVQELRQARLVVEMLSGDRPEAVQCLADQVGITLAKSGCSPLAKIAEVRARKAHGGAVAVAVVGDGINDAPALAEADVGIAMGGGTSLAREVGDVTLLGDSLGRLPWLLRLSRQTYRAIRQNLAWAFGYNLAAMTAAFFGYVHPLIAALAMLGSSFFVIHNSLRLSWFGSGPDQLLPLFGDTRHQGIERPGEEINPIGG